MQKNDPKNILKEIMKFSSVMVVKLCPSLDTCSHYVEPAPSNQMKSYLGTAVN